MRRYRIQDDGYTGFKHIYGDRERRPCGRVVRNADGNFTASVGKVSETGETEKDAFLQVWATVEGLDLSELHRALAPQTKTQPYTETVLDWLKVNAAENGGHPRFSNDDLARVLGRQKPNQTLGSLISRLDCACYCAGLPSIGLAADKPFPRAWGGNRERGRAWDFPIPKMRQRSQAHRWSDGDFEALKCETRGLAILKGRDAWEHEIAKHESRVKAWAEIEAAS
jgi:hypothetical protein